MDYYIASLKHTRPGDELITFWRANRSGYALPLAAAGRYTLDQVAAAPSYLNNGETTMAVPCDWVDPLGVPAPAEVLDTDEGPVVLNTPENWDTLRAIQLTLEPVHG